MPKDTTVTEEQAATNEAVADDALDKQLAALGVEAEPDAEDSPPPPPKDNDEADDQDESDSDDLDEEDEEEEDADEEPIELPDRLKRVAERFGITPERIAALGDDAEDFLDGLAAQWSREMSKLGRRKESPAEGDDDFPPDQDELPVLKEFTDDDLYELDAEKLNPIVQHLQGMKRRLARLEGDLQARQQTQARAAVDAFFDGLVDASGKPTHPQYGRGKTADLPKDSPQYRERQRLIESAAKIRKHFAAGGEDISPDEALDWARAKADNHKAPNRSRPRHRKRPSRTVRPTSRQATPGSNRERTADARLDAKAHELGIPLGD